MVEQKFASASVNLMTIASFWILRTASLLCFMSD